MVVKLKTGETLKLEDIGVNGTVLNGVNVKTGQNMLVSPDDILTIVQDSITLWDILRGLFFKIKDLIKKK